jgi:hypothetical protein
MKRFSLCRKLYLRIFKGIKIIELPISEMPVNHLIGYPRFLDKIIEEVE